MKKKKNSNVYFSDHGTYIMVAESKEDKYSLGIRAPSMSLQLTYKQLTELHDLINKVLASE